MSHVGDAFTTWEERDECHNCGKKDTMEWVCSSFSYDSGFSKNEVQCSACGASYDGETWEKIEHPSLWRYTSPLTKYPSPYALWRDDFHTRPTLQGTYSEEINVRPD